VPAAGVVGTDELTPAVMSAAFGNVNATSQVTRSGYIFQLFLPDATVGGATAGIAEDVGPLGGKAGAPFPDPDNGEVLWCAYAWPITSTQTGNRVFFMNQEGDLMQTNNRGVLTYTGVAGGPAFDAIYTGAADMASPISISGVPAVAQDGNTWVPVQ